MEGTLQPVDRFVLLDRFVLCIDADSFFVQVEQLRDPDISTLAVAVVQHGDIIALNQQAREAGVRKHMVPVEAQRLLQAVGGAMVNAYTLQDGSGRVSYAPYRNASACIMAVIASFGWAGPMERASIDEAYLEISPGSGMASAGGAEKLARDVQAEVLRRTGVRVSVGVSRNPLLAKLTCSARAKPFGVALALSDGAIQDILNDAPLTRLPGIGARACEALTQHLQLRTAGDLQRLAAQCAGPGTDGQLAAVEAIASACSVARNVAALAVRLAFGRDDSPVRPRGPPKSIAAQMSPTIAALPRRGPPPGPEVLGKRPIRVGNEDFKSRVRWFLDQICPDLVGRTEANLLASGEWPTTATVAIDLCSPSGDLQTVSRARPFPRPAWFLQAALRAHALRPSQPGHPPTPLLEGPPASAVLRATLQGAGGGDTGAGAANIPQMWAALNPFADGFAMQAWLDPGVTEPVSGLQDNLAADLAATAVAMAEVGGAGALVVRFAVTASGMRGVSGQASGQRGILQWLSGADGRQDAGARAAPEPAGVSRSASDEGSIASTQVEDWDDEGEDEGGREARPAEETPRKRPAVQRRLEDALRMPKRSRQGGGVEDDDPDLRAAIAASLAEMEAARAAQRAGSAGGGIGDESRGGLLASGRAWDPAAVAASVREGGVSAGQLERCMRERVEALGRVPRYLAPKKRKRLIIYQSCSSSSAGEQ